MAVYRNIQTTFWMDAKVADEFTPEDKYFYLYLFTNPHTNLCGCYEISKKQVALETGYSVDTIDRLIDRFQTIHKVISFDKSTREILLLNWHKYNWTKSDKFRMPLKKEIDEIKNESFRKYLSDIFDGANTVCIPYQYGMDTTVTDTVTVTVTDIKAKPKKRKRGEYLHVLLTDEEYQKLQKEYGNADELITFLDEYKEMKGYKCKNDYLAIRKWVVDAVKENSRKTNNHPVIPMPKMFSEEPDETTGSVDISEIKRLQEGMK